MHLAPLLLLYVVAGLLLQPGAEPVRDEPALLAAADRLVHHGQLAGTGADPDQRAYLWHGPGLVVLLAPLVALDAPLWLMRLTSPVLLFAAVALFHAALWTRLAPRPALAWTAALGLYAPFVIVLGTVQKEPLAILLVVAALHAAVRRRPAMAGAALAALAMVRLEYGWVILALLAASAVVLALRRRSPVARASLVTAAVALLGCLPWLAYTRDATGRELYWGASSGLSLFWMSPTAPGETGQWHSPVRVFTDDALTAYRPLFRRLDEVHPVQSDAELRRRAVANVRAEPLLYARNLAASAGRLLVFAPTRPLQPPGMLALYGIANGLLLVAVVWAARRLWRDRRRLPAEAGPVAAFALLGVLVHLPPSASPRMLMPLVPALLWLVVLAQGRGRTRHRPARPPSP